MANANEIRKHCSLLKSQLSEYYDDIHIPFHYFRRNDWDIEKVLKENTDVLFYCSEYFEEGDNEYFQYVFQKYIQLVNKIFDPSSLLSKYLRKWDDLNNNSWMKSILTKNTYQYISPAYSVELFQKISIKEVTLESIKMNYIMALNKIRNNAITEIKVFKTEIQTLVQEFIMNAPIDLKEHYLSVKQFIRKILMAIYRISEKLIDLNVYAIHPIICCIIDNYVSLDDFIYNKKMCVV